MKIRTDFVTNSSSSSFVAFGIYDEELAEKVEAFIKKYKAHPKNAIGWIGVNRNVISITRELNDVDRYEHYVIDKTIATGEERTKQQIAADEKKALTIDNVVNSFKDFFNDKFLTPEIEGQIAAIFEQGGVVCRLYLDEADGFSPQDFGNMASALKKKRASTIAKPVQTLPQMDPPKKHNPRDFNIYQGKLIKYLGKEKNLYLPDNFTILGSCAFSGTNLLKNLVVPNTVVTLEDQAFRGCSALESVIISEVVTCIPNSAFAKCSSLTTITVPNAVTKIGKNAFKDCSSLTRISLSSSLTTIGEDWLSGCSSLAEIEVGENPNFKSIDGNLYNGDGTILIQYAPGKKETTFSVPDTVKCIGENAFKDCATLVNVTIPSSVTTIGDNAFGGCTALASINIPNSVTVIGPRAFFGCTALTNVTLPDSILRVAENTFYNCASLPTINLPASVADIGEYAFAYCGALTEVVIPKSVTYIADFAFDYCSALAIRCEAESLPAEWGQLWNILECPVTWGFNR